MLCLYQAMKVAQYLIKLGKENCHNRITLLEKNIAQKSLAKTDYIETIDFKTLKSVDSIK